MFEPDLDWLRSVPLELAERRIAESPFADDVEGLGPDLVRSLGWTLLIADHQDTIEMFAAEVRSFEHAAIGFLSPEVDRDLGRLPPFGVILYADRVPGDEQGSGVLGGFDIDTPHGDIPVPIAVRRGQFEEEQHAVPPLPGGSAAYWATSRRGTIQGWLTARHVADSVTFLGSGHAILDRASSCVDAALVDVGVTATAPQHAPAHRAIAAALPIEMACRPGVAATVLDVSTNIRISRSTRFPLRFAMSHTGNRATRAAQSRRRRPQGVHRWASTSARIYLTRLTEDT